MKTSIITALGAATFLGLGGAAIAAPAAGPTAVVTVDVHRIYQECTACKAAQTALQGQAAQIQSYVQQQQTALAPEQQQLEAQQKAFAGKAPDAAFQTRAQAFITRRNGIEQQVQTRQEALQRNQNYVLKQINDRLGPIVTNVMNAHHASVAVDTNATLAAAPSIDVTPEVLAQLNQQLPSVAATAPTAPAGTSAGADGR